MMRYYSKLLIIMCVLVSSCTKDEEQYTDRGIVPEKTFVIDNNAFGIKADKTEAKATTDGINKAIEKAKSEGYNTVKLNKGDYLIYCVNESDWYATDGIFIPTNMTLDLGEAKLYVEPNDAPHYALIQIDHVENVTVRGGHIIGDRAQHTNKNHALGYGIQVIASRNVKIENVKIESVTGSGIIFTTYVYISFHGKFPSKNVKVTGCDISDCGKHGIHAVENKGLEISNNKIYNIRGSLDQYAIDINPNSAWKSVMENVKINNNIIENCNNGMRLWGGSDIEVYENHFENLNIFGIHCQRVQIYKNTLTDTGTIYISASSENGLSEDYCIPTEGDKKNICYKITDNSTKTPNFTCP